MIQLNLQPGAVLMVMDFAQNFEHKHAVEPQSSHWHHQQTTVHPVVCYYSCPACQKLHKEELIMLSSDKTHDAFAVKAFEDTALQYLNSNSVPVKHVIQFTDNCAAQYKSHLPFDIISQCSVAYERHYFGAKYGKGPGDAAIGRVSRQVDDHNCTEQSDICDMLSMFEYCSSNLSVTKFPNGCVHPQVSFFHVEKIDHTFPILSKTLGGTQCYHCMRNTGMEGKLEVHFSSCFCSSCEAGDVAACQSGDLAPPYMQQSV